MSVTTAEDLKKVALTKLAEIIQSGASQDQAAYLAKAYEEISKAEANEKIVEALLLLPQYKESAENAQKAAQDILNAAGGLVKLGKPAIRLFGRIQSNNYRRMPFWITQNASSNESLFSYGRLEDLKNNFIKQSSPVLELMPRDVFNFQLGVDTYSGYYLYAWSLYILRNSTDSEKKVSLTARLSSRTSGNGGAYIVANGSKIYSYTSNNVVSPSFSGNSAITVPPNSGVVIYVQTAAYQYNCNNGHCHMELVHDIQFTLPEGVDWDYEAYAQLLN